MAGETISPNMSLPIPGTGVTGGPQYATDINNCLNILDGHDHSTGSGVQITPSGLNINADLAINNNNIDTARALRFQIQGSTPALPADIACVYVVGLDLYYTDASGNVVRITQGGSVTGATGTITGLPSGTASASYAAGTFVFQSATSTAANVDGGSFIFRNATASSFGLTLQPPNAMAGNFNLTLPSIPSVKKVLSLDTSGNIVADQIIPLGPQFSSPSASYSSTSTSLTGVTLLNLSVTSTGRPLVINLVHDGLGGQGLIRLTNLAFTSSIGAYIAIQRDTDMPFIFETRIGNDSFDGITTLTLPPGVINTIDPSPTPGPHTYFFYVQCDSGTQISVFNNKLMGYEL